MIRMHEARPTESGSMTVSGGRLLMLAAGLGLFAGLMEGVMLLVSHGYGVLNTRIPEGVSPEILWISPIVSLFLYLLVAAGMILLGRIWQGFNVLRVSPVAFCFLAIVASVSSIGRISPIGTVVLAAGIGAWFGRWMYVRRAPLLSHASGALTWMAVLTVVVALATEGGMRFREHVAAKRLPPAAASSPNVLVIVVDTLRADHLSSYGYTRPTSPHIDAIAQQGVAFSQAISTSSWTLPAHQSLLTGRYPHEHGPLREQILNPSYPTLSEILGEHGYRTAAFSANTDFFCRRAGFAHGFLHFEDYFYSFGDMVYRTFWGRLFFRSYVAGLMGVDELPARRKAAEVNRSALEWIDQDRKEPFFAFLNYFDVHSPYVPERSYRYKFAKTDAQIQCAPSLRDRLNPLHRLTEFEHLLQLSPACFQLQMDEYDGGISYVDDQIANMFAELAQRGLDKNTLVIVTSDHGESFREHGLVTHGTSLYRELIRVPLIYWWPGHLPAGMRIDQPVTAASLPATILDMIGDSAQKQFPVPSLSVLWRQPGITPDWPHPLSEMAQDLYIPQQYPAYRGWLKSITDERWHLIVSQTDPQELYEYPQDPAETHNLAGSAEGKQVIGTVEPQLWNQVTPDKRSAGGPDLQPDATRSARAGQ